MMEAVDQLRRILRSAPDELRKIQAKPPAPAKWSVEEEFGHLLDSAAVNHYRLLRGLTEDNPSLAGYDGARFVELHHYATWKWEDLIQTWTVLNQHFLSVAELVSSKEWDRPCSHEGKTGTLEFLFADYVRHLRHHLQHIGIAPILLA